MKLAAKYNVEGLLPPGKKSTEYKETRRAERGLQIKGTGIGQKVKGHKWERTMESRLEDRRRAMIEMPELIRAWKQVSFAVLVLGLASGWIADILDNREVTAVDGRSGPRGNMLFLAWDVWVLYCTIYGCFSSWVFPALSPSGSLGASCLRCTCIYCTNTYISIQSDEQDKICDKTLTRRCFSVW